MAFLPGLFGEGKYFGPGGAVQKSVDYQGWLNHENAKTASAEVGMSPDEAAAYSAMRRVQERAYAPPGNAPRPVPAPQDGTQDIPPEPFNPQQAPPFDLSALLAAMRPPPQSPFALGGAGQMSYGALNALQFNPTDQLGRQLEGQRMQALGGLGLGGGMGMMGGGGRGYF